MNKDYDNKNSVILNLERLNIKYKNLLTEYELAVSNYVNYLKQEGTERVMSTIKGAAFWGTSSLSQQDSQSLEECKALCASTTGCGGATYNLTNGKSKCMLRSGDGTIVSGSSNDTAIVPKETQLLSIVKNINEKLTQTNKQIQKLTKPAEKQFDIETGKRIISNNVLIEQYKDLIKERNQIESLLKEYQVLDEQQTEGNITISQNYYSFILLMIIAMLVIFLLYKFSVSQVASSSTSVVQSGGKLGTSVYYIIFGCSFLILALILYNKFVLH